jgi:hypothetical protein
MGVDYVAREIKKAVDKNGNNDKDHSLICVPNMLCYE